MPEQAHRIVVVGGGAGGLELATRLGNTLGRRGKAHVTLIDRRRTHLWKPLLHEVAAGSMDQGLHKVDYQAQAHWHHFIFRYGEMIGLDRERKELLLAPTYDEEGREITARRVVTFHASQKLKVMVEDASQKPVARTARFITLSHRPDSLPNPQSDLQPD